MLDKINSLKGYMPLHEGEALAKWAEKFSKVGPILEIGTFTGLSALTMGLAMNNDSNLIAIDKNKQTSEIAKNFFVKANLENKINLLLKNQMTQFLFQ